MTDILEQVQQGDLYALLSLCTKEELAPLVERILSKVSNFLEINDDYKKFCPDHTKYYKIIGDEIRLFGGNSLINVFRGGEGPSYSEVVVDVCNKLNVPHKAGDTIKNENNLLDIYLKKRWLSLSAAERERFTREAREAALGKVSDLARMTKTGAAFVIAEAFAGPLGWTVLGIGLLSASYKVTIPCVLQIACLRRKITEEQRGRKYSQPKIIETSKDENTSPVIMEASNSLVIRTDDGETIFTMAQVEEPFGGHWEDFQASESSISNLNPLLALVPALATAKEIAGTNYMEIITNGDRLMKTKDGVLKAITIDPNGKISGIAEVIEPSRLSAMVNASALWNVTSVLLAQKHLSDISNKLSDIKDAVNNIRKFQNEERHSLLTGSIRYFEQIAPSILAGELPGRVLQQIERHEADLLKVQEHLMSEIQSQTNYVKTLEDKEIFGSVEITQSIENQQKILSGLYQEISLCIRARACGWQLLCIFPGDEIGKKLRREDIQKSLRFLEENNVLLSNIDKYLRDRIHAISSFWNKETTLNERKLSLIKSTEILLKNISLIRDGIQRDLDKADLMFAAKQQPVSITVRVKDGHIEALMAP